MYDLQNKSRSQWSIISWSSDFAFYLEDVVYEHDIRGKK